MPLRSHPTAAYSDGSPKIANRPIRHFVKVPETWRSFNGGNCEYVHVGVSHRGSEEDVEQFMAIFWSRTNTLQQLA